MKTFLLDLICVAVLCVILSLGLSPFHSPKNEVTWLANRSGLRFGRYATVASSSAFQLTNAEAGESASVEIWVQPSRIWDSCTLLAIYTPGNLRQFSLRQSEAGLELNTEVRNEPDPPAKATRYISDVFRKPLPVFLTITSSAFGTSVYVDGVLLKTEPQFRFYAKELTGRLILGDSPGQPDNWSGEMLGLAIYQRELTATQVLRHYKTWTQAEQPDISENERNIALYLFGERAGNIVHDHASAAKNLYIPEKYIGWDKIFLEPFWKEFSMSWSYWDTFPKNIVGFIPFGICFYACLRAHNVRRATLATVILGTLVSLTIEVLQAYLPTRDSGTTDIFTNTIGTYIGVITWKAAGPILAAKLPWLPPS